MYCSSLATRLQRLYPESAPSEIARSCLLLLQNGGEQLSAADDASLRRCTSDLNIRLQAIGDQYAAVSDELNELAKSDPCRFHPDQIWILIRAIKIQGQLLQHYLGQTAVETA